MNDLIPTSHSMNQWMIGFFLTIPWPIHQYTFDPFLSEIYRIVKAIIDHQCDLVRMTDKRLWMLLSRLMIGKIYIGWMNFWKIELQPILCIGSMLILIAGGDDVESFIIFKKCCHTSDRILYRKNHIQMLHFPEIEQFLR